MSLSQWIQSITNIMYFFKLDIPLERCNHHKISKNLILFTERFYLLPRDANNDTIWNKIKGIYFYLYLTIDLSFVMDHYAGMSLKLCTIFTSCIWFNLLNSLLDILKKIVIILKINLYPLHIFSAGDPSAYKMSLFILLIIFF